ncbi:MAG: BMP family ABC transporter substrate-binding protein [Ignavibacteria bacterium]|nr:BMP family ABC transporter substrate-binding protein [Ignavibacteria bacterium]
MKKNIICIFSVLMVCTLISCEKKKEPASPDNNRLKVGLVFDVGGKGDKSFNDAAYKGLERAKNELGIEFEIIDPGDGSDRESALRRLSSRTDIGLIFGVGFIFTDDITRIAQEFTQKKFACVDYTITHGKEIPTNLLALEFKEDEGSFLVGAIAGLLTTTNIVGFLGGMESALIKKFESGYIQGVKYVNPGCKILTAYVSVTGEGFKNAPKAKEISLTQYSNGADIIYHASGLSGIGLFEAAKELNKLAIGVDLDQYTEAPGQVLTSMTKQVDEVIFQAVKDYKENEFNGGTKTLGLKEKGVDYVYDDNNKNLITEEIRTKIEIIREKIISGEIKIHTQ